MTDNKLPCKTIKLGGSTYAFRHLTEEEATDNFGLCNREEPLYVGINREIHGALLLDTVIHEVLHAIMWERRIIHMVDNVVDLEEFLVTNMATGLLEVLRTNPKLRRWLLTELEKC